MILAAAATLRAVAGNVPSPEMGFHALSAKLNEPCRIRVHVALALFSPDLFSIISGGRHAVLLMKLWRNQ